LRDLVASVLLAFGLAVIVASCVGMAVLDEPMDRLHLVTPASTLGVTAACAAVVARQGLDASGTAAVLLAAVTVVTSPLVSHACARSIEVRRQAEQSRAEQSGAEQSGAEQSGAEQSGAEQSGAEQSGAEQSGAEPAGGGQK
jgi:multisubunit Na+/H+ antiporter MnhG subunit